MTAIYYDPDDDRIVIEGALQTYAPRTLTADCSADMVWIRLKVRSSNEFGPVPYAAITDRSGAGFGDAASAVAYLMAEFAKRPCLGCTFVQDQPSSIWTIAHQLGFVPAVTLVDTAGDVFEGDIRHLTSSTILVTLSAPTAGSAYLS